MEEMLDEELVRDLIAQKDKSQKAERKKEIKRLI